MAFKNFFINNHLFVHSYIKYLIQIICMQFYGPEDRGSIPGRGISKTQKIILDAALIYTVS